MSDEVATAMAKYYAADKARTEARKVLEAALAAEARRSREERDDLRKEAACYIGDVHPFVTAVQKVVADFFNLTVAGLSGKRQSRDYSEPRHMAVFLCMEMPELTATHVARGFGMKGTSNVKYAQRVVPDRRSIDTRYAQNLIELRRRSEHAVRAVKLGVAA
jgi:chromosomal replication initiation ATPase DnaA